MAPFASGTPRSPASALRSPRPSASRRAPALATPTIGVPPWYVIQAYNKRGGTPPVILITSSMSSELYIEGEGN
jgi:hypothetical protein